MLHGTTLRANQLLASRAQLCRLAKRSSQLDSLNTGTPSKEREQRALGPSPEYPAPPSNQLYAVINSALFGCIALGLWEGV